MRLAALVLLLGGLAAAQPGYRVRLLYNHPKHAESRTITIAPEDYVAGVLAGEASVFRSEESLKAMAVAARTYALRYRGRHQREGFDFCDTTHCQDLRLEAVTRRVRQAAEATEGEVLWRHGSPAAAFYHRHCGGTTEAAGYVWPDLSAPYLRQLKDTFCISRGRGEWSAAIGKEELRKALEAEGIRMGTPPEPLLVLERTPSGRALRIRAGEREITAAALHQAVGRTLGWDLLRSTFFEVRSSGHEMVFQGYGSGHGVGLCQAGAAARGEEGHTYRQILAFYYPGTVLGINAQGFTWRYLGGERVEVYTAREQEDQELVVLGDRLLAEAERRAGFGYAQRPRIRVYPTVTAYRDATGESGAVAASTVGRTIRMQPAAVLRPMGELERTLLHELLHVVVESRAHPSLPDWFREGLVIYLAGAPPPAAEYQALAERVRSLVAKHGQETMMDWLQRGIPAELANERGQR